MRQFKIAVDDAQVRAALDRLTRAAADPGPVLAEIGEDLVVIGKRSFAESRSPDGDPWAPNSDAVLRALLHRGKGNFKKRDGSLTAEGDRVLAAKKPLIGETRALSTQIHYNVAAGVLEVGSTMEYAAMHRFGGAKVRFPNL